MDTTAPPAPRSPQSGPVRAASLPISEGPPPARRRWGWFAACVALAVLGVLVAVSMVASAGDRVQVLAVAQDVPIGQKITDADLVVAQVAKDPAVQLVPVADRKQVVGQRAAVGLRKGSLLSPRQYTDKDELGAGKQLVGVEAKRGQMPLQALAPGDEVLVVTTPAPGQAGKTDPSQNAPIPATVVMVGTPDATGTTVVNLAVAATDGPLLAQRAAGGNVALVRQARG